MNMLPFGRLTWCSYRRISQGSTAHDTKGPITLLRDGNQPFVFDITFFNRPYRFEFYDTSSPENWTLLHPDVIVLCYDISSRLSLIHAQRFVSSCLRFSQFFRQDLQSAIFIRRAQSHELIPISLSLCKSLDLTQNIVDPRNKTHLHSRKRPANSLPRSQTRSPQ